MRTPRLMTGPTPEQWKQINELLEKHGLSKAQLGRIAIERLLKKPVTGPEIERAKVPQGNPEAGSELGKKGAEARWSGIREKEVTPPNVCG